MLANQHLRCLFNLLMEQVVAGLFAAEVVMIMQMIAHMPGHITAEVAYAPQLP